jgi:hypothetical protein
MATIHISETEAARDFAGIIAEVRSGAEIIIENGTLPLVILRSEFPVRRTVSECIELARKHEQETDETPILDPDFADDAAQIIDNRKLRMFQREVEITTGPSPESPHIGCLEDQGSTGPEFFDPLSEDELPLRNGEGD